MSYFFTNGSYNNYRVFICIGFSNYFVWLLVKGGGGMGINTLNYLKIGITFLIEKKTDLS